MSEDTDSIPAVSVAAIAASVAEADLVENDLVEVGEQLAKALTDTGFCYITDHGVDESLTDRCFDVGKDFFALPLETKKKRLRGESVKDYYGWMPKPYTEGIDREPETFSASMIPDYKETYNLSDRLDESRFPSDDEVSGFRSTTLQVIDAMRLISDRVLIALGYGLKLEDPRALQQTSAGTGAEGNDTTLRFAFYPEVSIKQMEEGCLRCAEHTDFGLITLLLDNGVSGLQILKRDGKYAMVPRRPGALVVNVADSLERLTGGVLRSAHHRVVLTEENMREDRYSVIYFRAPDYGVYLDPMCGAKEKYQNRMKTEEFIQQRFIDIFRGGAGITKLTSD